MIFKIFLYILLLGISLADNRKISLYINPGCGKECNEKENVLIHVRADGPNDTLHHIWDFTNKPTVILALSSLDSVLAINWTSFHNYNEEAIQFSIDPFYSFSFIFDKVIEFNDVNETAIYDSTINSSSYSVVYNTNFKWTLEKYINTSNVGYVSMKTNHHHLKNGNMTIMLSAFGTTEHTDIQPHLLHTNNATQIEVKFDNIPTTSGFKSRIALGFILVSSDIPNSTFNEIFKKSINDEHSPGVFKIGEVRSTDGYLEWRSIAYSSYERLMTNSTGLNSKLSNHPNLTTIEKTAITSLFGSNLHNMLVQDMFVSFGSPKDVFYSMNPFISWSFLGGIGAPLNEDFSLLFYLIVGLGLGLPSICIVILFLFLMARISQSTLVRSEGRF